MRLRPPLSEWLLNVGLLVAGAVGNVLWTAWRWFLSPFQLREN